MIKFIRLVTGEDIVAEVTGRDGLVITISNPLKLVYMANPMKTSRLSITFMQWVFDKLVDQKTFELSLSNVLLMKDASSDVIEYYKSTVEYFDQLTTDKEEEMEDDQPWITEPLDEEESKKAMEELLGKIMQSRKDGKLN